MIMLHNNNNKNFLKFPSKLLFLTNASIGYVGFSFSRLNLAPRVGFGSVPCDSHSSQGHTIVHGGEVNRITGGLLRPA